MQKNIKDFSSEQLLPLTGPESVGPGLEYLDTLGLGPEYSYTLLSDPGQW